MQFSNLDIQVHEASQEFEAVAEADIRGAHGEIVQRPRLTGVPEHVYEALIHSNDEDQKAYDAEIDAQLSLRRNPPDIP